MNAKQGWKKRYTYTDEENRQRGQHGEHEDGRDDLGRVLGIGAEDVVDLGLLAVAQGRLVDDGRRVGVAGQLDVEEGLVEALRGSEAG